MGKFTRRGGAIAAVSIAGVMALSTVAMADVIDGEPIVDGAPENGAAETGVFRFFGPDRIETAVRAAERVQFNEGGEPDTVILANSEVFADALAASTLADALDAPVLLNTPGNDNINEAVEDYFEGRDEAPARVIVLGGNDIFNEAFREYREAASGVAPEVVAGANRYETALELAQLTVTETDVEIENVFLASGTDFPDALASGAAAAANNGVVLLTRGDEALTQTTFDAINTDGEFDGEAIVAIGGPAVDAAANGSPDGDPIEVDEEIVGDDRYETAVEVADTYLSSGASEADNLVVTSGENFPDAVVGGAFAANVDGALLLTKNDALPMVTRDFLESETIDADSVFVFGGESSVSNDVAVEIADIENPLR